MTRRHRGVRTTAVGIDHVLMNIAQSAGTAVIEAIQRLATKGDLVVYDPQGDAVYMPVRAAKRTAATCAHRVAHGG